MRKLVILFIILIYPLYSYSQVDLTTELNKIIGVTNGYGLANKALILNSNRSIFNIRRASIDTMDVPLVLRITSGRLEFAGNYRMQGGPTGSFSFYNSSNLIWAYDIGDGYFTLNANTNIIGNLAVSSGEITVTGDTVATLPEVRNMMTGGLVFTNDILEWDGTSVTFRPYTSLAAGIRFYTGISDPTGTTRLNLNARLYPTGITTSSYSSTPGLDVSNATTGYGVFVNNTSTGLGLGINNANTGNGISIANSNNGNGLSIINSGTTGNGFVIENNTASTARAATITNGASYADGVWITTGTGTGLNSGSLLVLEKAKSGTDNQVGSFITIWDRPTSVGTKDGAVLEALVGATHRTLLYPRVPSGATAVAYLFDTENTLTQGYRARFMNHGVSSVDIQYDGSIDIPTGASIKTNNVSTLYITGNSTSVGDHSNTNRIGTYNTTMGYYAGNALLTGGTYNTLIGSNAGAGITTGDNNIALGHGALFRTTTGSNNIAIGILALEDISTGSENIAIGSNAAANTTASSNVAIGYGALASNTSGSYNIAIGQQTMGSSTIRSDNIAIGYQSLSGVLTGGSNVAMGSQALNITTGAGNTGLGHMVGASNTSGSNNVFMGYYAGRGNTTGSNNISLGYYAGRYNGTLSNRGYLNSIDRVTQAGDTTLSPIYFLQSATRALQKIYINGNLIISDSLRLTNLLDAPEYNHQWLGLTPTGAVYADSLSNAGFMLTMEELPTLPSLLSDKVNGEIKWYYKEGDKVKYSYGLSKLRPTQQIQALMASSEMDKRYIKTLEDKVNSLEDRLNTLERLLLNKN